MARRFRVTRKLLRLHAEARRAERIADAMGRHPSYVTDMFHAMAEAEEECERIIGKRLPFGVVDTMIEEHQRALLAEVG